MASLLILLVLGTKLPIASYQRKTRYSRLVMQLRRESTSTSSRSLGVRSVSGGLGVGPALSRRSRPSVTTTWETDQYICWFLLCSLYEFQFGRTYVNTRHAGFIRSL